MSPADELGFPDLRTEGVRHQRLLGRGGGATRSFGGEFVSETGDLVAEAVEFAGVVDGVVIDRREVFGVDEDFPRGSVAGVPAGGLVGALAVVSAGTFGAGHAGSFTAVLVAIFVAGRAGALGGGVVGCGVVRGRFVAGLVARFVAGVVDVEPVFAVVHRECRVDPAVG